MGVKRFAYRVSVNPKEISLESCRHMWEDNIKMVNNEI
jgi:hypothetical protein